MVTFCLVSPLGPSPFPRLPDQGCHFEKKTNIHPLRMVGKEATEGTSVLEKVMGRAAAQTLDSLAPHFLLQEKNKSQRNC